MLAGMQGFRDMFSGSHPAKKLLRDIGLKLADTLPGVKPQLIRQAMGLHDLPAGYVKSITLLSPGLAPGFLLSFEII